MPSLTIPDLPFPEYEAQDPPKLTFTKVVAASFNGKAVKHASWNRLLDTALNYAANDISNFERLQNIAAVNMVKGKKTKEGYRYLPEADLSVQGQKADQAQATAQSAMSAAQAAQTTANQALQGVTDLQAMHKKGQRG